MLYTKSKRLLLITALLLLVSCSSKQPFFYDFETEDVLDTLTWKCKTFFSLSNKYATSGQKSLKMELYPSSYPGITLNKFNPNWSNFTVFMFDIYNEEQVPLHLAIRIDDKKNPSFNNRYNHTIILNPGMNHISIPLDSLITTGKKQEHEPHKCSTGNPLPCTTCRKTNHLPR